MRTVPLAEEYCKKTIRHLAGEPGLRAVTLAWAHGRRAISIHTQIQTDPAPWRSGSFSPPETKSIPLGST